MNDDARPQTTADLVASLRDFAGMPTEAGTSDPLIEVMGCLATQAADEIERLRPLAAERQAQLDHEARMRRPPVFTDELDGWGGGA